MKTNSNPLHRRTWRERMMQKYGMGIYMPYQADTTIPKWMLECIGFFFIAMFACWAIFGRVPNWDVALVAGVSVV